MKLLLTSVLLIHNKKIKHSPNQYFILTSKAIITCSSNDYRYCTATGAATCLSWSYPMVILQHPSVFYKSQTGEWNGDMIGTIASASFRSLLIYTLWLKIHYCFLFTILAEWQFQSLFCLLCYKRPYATNQVIDVGVVPKIKYANYNYTFRCHKMTAKMIHGSL